MLITILFLLILGILDTKRSRSVDTQTPSVPQTPSSIEFKEFDDEGNEDYLPEVSLASLTINDENSSPDEPTQNNINIQVTDNGNSHRSAFTRIVRSKEPSPAGDTHCKLICSSNNSMYYEFLLFYGNVYFLHVTMYINNFLMIYALIIYVNLVSNR